MFRFAPGWAHFIAQPLFDDPPPDGGAGGGGGGGATKDAAYWENEAKKAFAARDLAKGEIKKLQESGLVLTPDQKARLAELEDAAAKAEEDRQKKAGEFESLKKSMLDKHQQALTERDTKLTTLSQRFQNTVVRAEFGTATELFGGADAKTVLDVEMAIAVLGKYVSVVDDEKAPAGYRIVVKNAHGDELQDARGNPLPFGQALAEVISSLPNKDRILRGSGKAGSGASGGSGRHGTDTIDYRNLTLEQMRDPKIREEAKRRTAAAGGVVYGEAFERSGDAKR